MSKVRAKAEIKTSSTAEYFAKNLQQVGFSSPTKAVLTTLKEAFDNSLDACEEHGIPPTIRIVIERTGKGSTKNTDQILVRVEDNGPGIAFKDLPKVFGEYLASSKFGRGRCTRGQQGIGISAATTWAMQTSAQGVYVVTKQKGQKKAVRARIEIDLKNNRGVLKDKEDIDWDRPHGTLVEFLIDGRVQLNGEAGLQAFLRSNVLVNPHLEIHYKLLDEEEVHIERVSTKVPHIPEATSPHPHTMKLGEFLAHAKLFGTIPVRDWLQNAFSRITDPVFQDLIANHQIPKKMFDRLVPDLKEDEFKQLFSAIQEAQLLPPSTGSVLAIGEAGLAKSILRLGDIDYFSVVTRRPAICDFKPIQVEVALARLSSSGQRSGEDEEDESVQVLRFANRVPLQFDKAGCAIVKAITTVNWKVYGLKQARGQIPSGPYIIAVSVVSPFIKFKNASKETIDASDELVEEIRRALMQAGQRLSRHLRREHKEAMLESKMQHIEQFAPILVDGLVRLTESNDSRKAAAHEGLLKILGRDTQVAERELEEADRRLEKHLASKRKRLGAAYDLIMAREQEDQDHDEEIEEDDDEAVVRKSKENKKGERAVAETVIESRRGSTVKRAATGDDSGEILAGAKAGKRGKKAVASDVEVPTGAKGKKGQAATSNIRGSGGTKSEASPTSKSKVTAAKTGKKMPAPSRVDVTKGAKATKGKAASGESSPSDAKDKTKASAKGKNDAGKATPASSAKGKAAGDKTAKTEPSAGASKGTTKTSPAAAKKKVAKAPAAAKAARQTKSKPAKSAGKAKTK